VREIPGDRGGLFITATRHSAIFDRRIATTQSASPLDASRKMERRDLKECVVRDEIAPSAVARGAGRRPEESHRRRSILMARPEIHRRGGMGTRAFLPKEKEKKTEREEKREEKEKEGREGGNLDRERQRERERERMRGSAAFRRGVASSRKTRTIQFAGRAAPRRTAPRRAARVSGRRGPWLCSRRHASHARKLARDRALVARRPRRAGGSEDAEERGGGEKERSFEKGLTTGS